MKQLRFQLFPLFFMSKTNTKTRMARSFTHEGGQARTPSLENQLRRSVMACMLWEDEFYEGGQEIASRIKELVAQVDSHTVADLALEAREAMKLRHIPLLLLRELARKGDLEAPMLYEIIQRPDELSEFVSLYWKDGKQPLSAQVKKGLAAAFTKFSGYQLAKYNRDADIKLRDVLFLCHAKPIGDMQAQIFKQLVDGTLDVPDTWEVALSAGADKKETFERLIVERKLGGLALLRNLRNMQQAGVEQWLIKEALSQMDTSRILPFRFIAAARYAPSLEAELEQAMFKSIASIDRLDGNTLILIDVSGSMNQMLSRKSDMRRIDAACGLAMIVRELADNVSVMTFSDNLVEVPARRGFALRDAINASQRHGNTYLGKALNSIDQSSVDRLIVITDEQSADTIPNPQVPFPYMINVASNKNGVGYGPWMHIDGFSENVMSYILESEQV